MGKTVINNRKQNTKKKSIDFSNLGGLLSSIDSETVGATNFKDLKNATKGQDGNIQKRNGHILEIEGDINKFIKFKPSSWYTLKSTIEYIRYLKNDLETAPVSFSSLYTLYAEKTESEDLTNKINFKYKVEETGGVFNIPIEFYSNEGEDGTRYELNNIYNVDFEDKDFVNYDGFLILPTGDIRPELVFSVSEDGGNLTGNLFTLPFIVFIPYYKDGKYTIKGFIPNGRYITSLEYNDTSRGVNLAVENPLECIKNVSGGVVSNQGTTSIPPLPKPSESGALETFYTRGSETLKIAWKIVDPNGTVLVDQIKDPTGENPVYPTFVAWDADLKFKRNIVFSKPGVYNIQTIIIDNSKITGDPDEIPFYNGSAVNIEVSSDHAKIESFNDGLFTCDNIIVNKNRLYLFGDKYKTTRLYLSDFFDVEYFPAYVYIELITPNYSPIVAGKVYSGNIIWFSEASIIHFLGDPSTGDLKIEEVTSSFGVYAKRSIIDTGESLFFLTTGGVKNLKRLYNSNTQVEIKAIGTEIKKTLLKDPYAFGIWHNNSYNIIFPKKTLEKNYSAIINGSLSYISIYRRMVYLGDFKQWFNDESIIFGDSNTFQSLNGVLYISNKRGLYREDPDIWTDAGFEYDFTCTPGAIDCTFQNHTKKFKSLDLMISTNSEEGIGLEIEVLVDGYIVVSTLDFQTKRYFKELGGQAYRKAFFERIPNIIVEPANVFDNAIWGTGVFGSSKVSLKYRVLVQKKGRILNYTLNYRGKQPVGLDKYSLIIKIKKA